MLGRDPIHGTHESLGNTGNQESLENLASPESSESVSRASTVSIASHASRVWRAGELWVAWSWKLPLERYALSTTSRPQTNSDLYFDPDFHHPLVHTPVVSIRTRTNIHTALNLNSQG